MLRIATAMAFAAAVLVACHQDSTPLRKSTPDYPCGIDGVVCAGDTCCDQVETCGGAFPSVGCPPGLCCYIGEVGAPLHSDPAVPRRMHPQVAQHQPTASVDLCADQCTADDVVRCMVGTADDCTCSNPCRGVR